MIDADGQRIAKHLGSIDHSLKQLVKIMEVFNENFVEVAKVFKNADVDIVTSGSWEDNANQMTLDEADKENGHDHTSG